MSFKKPSTSKFLDYRPQFLWPLSRWELHPAGRWAGASVPPGQRFVFVLAPENAKTPLTWAPMDEAPALHREAAGVAWADVDAVVEWVNRRGILWWRTGDDEEPDIRFGEVQDELRAIQVSVRLLDGLRNRGPLPKIRRTAPHVGDVLSASGDGEAWANQHTGRMRGLALGWATLADTLAGRLAQGLHTLLPVKPYRSVRIARREVDHVPALVGGVPALRMGGARFLPRSLAACLWWQLYLDASGAREYRLCLGCGKWFSPKRRDQDHHNDTCYLRVWRREGGATKSSAKR